jgi:alpha-beta hydrolase superfamily lysophospholipase
MLMNPSQQGADEITRPLIIIGHSMGGIVAAKVMLSIKATRTVLTCPDTMHSQVEEGI